MVFRRWSGNEAMEPSTMADARYGISSLEKETLWEMRTAMLLKN